MSTPPTGPISEAARIARAISHPVRLQILNELRDEGAYVMHLTTVLGRPQANISQHLMVLRQAGLVTAIRDGMTVLYQLSDPQVLTVVDDLLLLAQKQQAKRSLATGKAVASAPEQHKGRQRRGDCRCPRCSEEGSRRRRGRW